MSEALVIRLSVASANWSAGGTWKGRCSPASRLPRGICFRGRRETNRAQIVKTLGNKRGPIDPGFRKRGFNEVALPSAAATDASRVVSSSEWATR
jgi:hypothetical protein